MSTGKVAQAEYLRAKARDLWEKAKAGDVTIGGAYAQAKRKEQTESPTKPTEEPQEALRVPAESTDTPVTEIP
jgi:hypothetical protein